MDMILDEDQWPRWPVLPLKNHKNKAYGEAIPLVGVIISGKPSRVILINMLDIRQMTDQTPAMEYPSIAAMLADGWVVD
jgi:hypothetical protein